MCRKNQKKGFSLVEAILAMTILGIAATSIMATFSSALVSGSLSHDYAIASILLDDLRSYVRTNMLTPETVNEGAFTNFPKYSWQVIYTITEFTDLYHVEFLIVWQRGTKQYRVSAVTYHYYEMPETDVIEPAEL